MEKKERVKEYVRKIIICTFALALFILTYYFVKKILPLIWPFVVVVIIAGIIKPAVMLLHKKLRLPVAISTFLVLTVIIVGILYGGTMLINTLLEQVRSLMSNYDYYADKAEVYVCDMCYGIGNAIGVNGQRIYDGICMGVSEYADKISAKVMQMAMGTSIPVFIWFVEAIVCVAVIIAGVFLYISRMEETKTYIENCYLSREIGFIIKRIREVGVAYFKAEIIIMTIVCTECVIGLYIEGNDYALVLGLIIGILDALPMIGVGAVLIPWTIVSFLIGNFMEGAIIFTIFTICYFTREFLEPRIIGNKIGINPFVSLIIIYVGFKLFGVIGLFLAPLIFIIISDLTGKFIEFMKS